VKIAIVSDLHLGYEKFEEDAYKQAKEALEAASVMADVILIPGDIFDKRAPKPDSLAQAINIFRELSKRKWNARIKEVKGRTIFTSVPIIAIPGTHERTTLGRENALELLSLAGLLADISEATAIVEKGNESIAVYGLGGLSEERVKEKLSDLNIKPVKGMFNAFIFHQSVYEILPFGQDLIHFDDLPKGFDLYIDGHVHDRYEGKAHGKPFLIPGSTVITQLKESEQKSKAFILFDTTTNSYKFVDINSRTFISKRIKIKDKSPEELSKECISAIEETLSKNHDKPIIRLVLEGTLKEGAGKGINMRSIVAKYTNRAYIDIDASRLTSPELEKSIEELRENKFEGVSIKELGMSILRSKLKEQKFDSKIEISALFDILSEPSSKKDKTIEKVLKFLESN